MGEVGFSRPTPLVDGQKLIINTSSEIVDLWAKHYAHKARAQGSAIVYVSRPMAENPSDMAAGFYTLSAHSIVRDTLPGGWLKRNVPPSIPALLLGMLGVDELYQGRGLGSSLLKDAIQRSLGVAETVGAKALLVDPLDQQARAFYVHFGFSPIPNTARLYIPLRLPQ
ncbi:MAG: GNAT family N-acetyltransferase [Atopobiaceae bacterium]|nr:GNAT family N-acetyltransferase [Atopobiaceae bacterium]